MNMVKNYPKKTTTQVFFIKFSCSYGYMVIDYND